MYAITASKTVEVNIERLYWAFTDPAARERWLPGADLTVTTTSAPRSLRASWEQGSTRVAAGFTTKGPAKSQVALTHEKLPDAETAVRMKSYWSERLTALKQLLEG
jgi:hypothetical protein